MKIVADSNIPFAKQACAALGDVEILKASELSPERLRDCDVLLCRSTRRINAAVLDGTKVRFVATATIGVDHVDLEYLARRGIGFASAPGSNANSVSEYITSALLILARKLGRPLEQMSIGIVGVGNVGTRVAKKAEALGMQVILNDPPLARATGELRYRPLEDLMEADVVTMHVPLAKSGPDRTYHMAGPGFFSALKRGAIFINSARGGVMDELALHRAIDSGHVAGVVLDVWEHEPMFDECLVSKVDIATPHIAGHSFDGKVNGTKMVYDAACNFLGVAPTWSPDRVMPAPAVPRIPVDVGVREDEEVIRDAVLGVYDVRNDDAKFRDVPPGDGRGDYFEALRRNYWPRREFHNTTVELKGGGAALRAKLAGLGFKL